MSNKSDNRLKFENLLRELCGQELTAYKDDDPIIQVIEEKIAYLFTDKPSSKELNPIQLFDCLNSILVYYGILPLSYDFFKYYFVPKPKVVPKDYPFINLENFKEVISQVKINALRLYNSINNAYYALNTSSDLESLLKPIKPKTKEEIENEYIINRTNWDRINNIPNENLSKLGYVAVKNDNQENKDRKYLADKLNEMADKKDRGETLDYPDVEKYDMKSLLEKFTNPKSTILQGILEPSFDIDVNAVRKVANDISPTQEQIEARKEVENTAYDNLTNYLAADYMDIYVATSMRNPADFISVNTFVEKLFNYKDGILKDLKLRYFNPTQSWIEDRIAKGLVEALMLKRANICIYMAQKGDTFGKDSEASVTLGQGKTVIVFVPKLIDDKLGIDSEKSGNTSEEELREEIKRIDKKASNKISERHNVQSLHSILIKHKLYNTTEDDIIRIIKNHWTDFDILGEVDEKFKNKQKVKKEQEQDKANIYSTLIKWLREVIENDKPSFELSNTHKEKLVDDVLVATAMNFEKRAKMFRDDHPLAVQVINDTRVLNGILVVRSIEDCAKLVESIIYNKLDLKLVENDHNYILREENTKSTIRVISKHPLIANAFKRYYDRNNRQ